ncbi:hsp90-like protein [Paraphaeosphaeria sporulosa]
MSTPRMRTSESGPRCLRGIGPLDLIDHDPRPTFVIDNQESDETGTPVPCHWNSAFLEFDSGQTLNALLKHALAHAITIAAIAPNGFADFKNWIAGNDESATRSYVYCNCTWIKINVSKQWTVISRLLTNNATTTSKPTSSQPGGAVLKLSPQCKTTTFDWTYPAPPERMTSHVAWARSIDWASTSLGPMNEWSPQLRSIATLVMQDARPAVVFCGADLIMIYNEAYIELLGGFHPCMGVSARVALESVWGHYFEPLIARNLAGETIEGTNNPIQMERNGFMEESYFSWSFIPIFNSEGVTIAHYEPLVETTREVIAERRANTILQLSEEVPRARNLEAYWCSAIEVLSHNTKDIPFAVLYSAEALLESSSCSSTAEKFDESQEFTLRGFFGLPRDSPAAVSQLDFHQNEGFMPYFREASAARGPVRVDLEPGSPAHELVRGVDWKGYGDPCRGAVVCPITPTSSKDNVLGYMVLGLNPRRPYDEDYRHFIMVASRLLSTSLTSILLHEDEIHRRERAIENAEMMKAELKRQLIATQKEVERNAMKFQRFAERADVGIFIVGLDGVYSYRNDTWWRMLDPEYQYRDVDLTDAWDALIDEEFIQPGKEKFQTLIETKQHQTWELKIKKTWTVDSQNIEGSWPNEEPRWILLSIQPELSETGDILEIVGCFQDISRQKFGEKLQATQALHAQESKRKLENFIDTTSHEMRNPLSAIVQCADSIISSHKAFQESPDYQATYKNILDSAVEAADTIVQCSKHMKTIVDDVLTMSKLDSGLFVMTPVDVPLQSIARDAVKMFEGEAKAAAVALEYHPEDSCSKINIEYVSLDPTRVLQILINLITNAIKFTRLEKTRHISVRLGVCTEPPLQGFDERVKFHRTPGAEESKALRMDWEKGEVVYIIFSVHDTGRGLSDAEHELLFARFSQASPRTHIDYGGSGLGLFISRRLTELHGGAISFTSKVKVGSTFSFYVKCRKASPPSPMDKSATSLSVRAQSTVLANRSRDVNDKPPALGRKLSESKEENALIKVLIVEDNLVNQRVLAKQLKIIGMHVAVANHGIEALEYLRKTKYCIPDEGTPAQELSLILMDWEMPVMDGLTCVREIRKLQARGIVKGHIPVIAVTANVRSEQVAEALEAGMDDVISKPFRIPELCACMHKNIVAVNGKWGDEA